MAGGLAVLEETSRPGRAHPHLAGEPRPGHHRGTPPCEEGPVREDQRAEDHPRHRLTGAGTCARRAEGLRHQHHRRRHAPGRGLVCRDVFGLSPA
ncbi:hypothetical protein ACFPRL_01150 [Pseudoclavibacter helvolus]